MRLMGPTPPVCCRAKIGTLLSYGGEERRHANKLGFRKSLRLKVRDIVVFCRLLPGMSPVRPAGERKRPLLSTA